MTTTRTAWPCEHDAAESLGWDCDKDVTWVCEVCGASWTEYQPHEVVRRRVNHTCDAGPGARQFGACGCPKVLLCIECGETFPLGSEETREDVVLHDS